MFSLIITPARAIYLSRQHLKFHTSFSRLMTSCDEVSYKRNNFPVSVSLGSHCNFQCHKCPFSSCRFFASNSLQCWKCQFCPLVSSPICEACQSIQPVDESRNYFEVLGLPKLFNVNTKDLKLMFRQLQTRLHPDKFSVKSTMERDYAAEHSALINRAYRCLLHPIERAEYLLELSGQPLHEQQIDLDSEFLMEIMDVNEELAEADSKEAVQMIGKHNQRIISNLLSKADGAFKTGNISLASKMVAKLKYYNNIYEKVKEFERENGIVD